MEHLLAVITFPEDASRDGELFMGKVERRPGNSEMETYKGEVSGRLGKASVTVEIDNTNGQKIMTIEITCQGLMDTTKVHLVKINENFLGTFTETNDCHTEGGSAKGVFIKFPDHFFLRPE